MKTYIPKPKDIHHEWLLIDASGQRLGRLATKVATLLRGKHKPIYTPFLDTGDFVVIINAEKISFSGKKEEQKIYFRHSSYPGGSTFTPLKSMMKSNPEMVLKKAIWGMVPHNALGRKIFSKLKIYAGPDHPHQAQAPVKA